MKKGLFALLMAVAMVVPVFAKGQGDFDIVGKIGATINPVVVYDGNPADYSYDQESGLSIAVEGFYYLLPELSLGLGINYQADSALKNTYENRDLKHGATNVYLTIKPTATIDSKIFTALYAMTQIGYGLNRLGGDGYSLEEIENDALYWGLGAGVEIKNSFIFEFVFSTSYYKMKRPLYTVVIDETHTKTYYSTQDMRNTALTVFVGYKFNV